MVPMWIACLVVSHTVLGITAQLYKQHQSLSTHGTHVGQMPLLSHLLEPQGPLPFGPEAAGPAPLAHATHTTTHGTHMGPLADVHKPRDQRTVQAVDFRKEIL
jgi:hypothetical protein